MNAAQIFIIALGLSADAFAVSISCGLSAKHITSRFIITTGLFFGISQGLMPAIGFFLASFFAEALVGIGDWITIIVFIILGTKTLIEALRNKSENIEQLNIKTMIALAFATSIDAFAVGVSFAFIQVNLLIAVLIIAVTTFTLCCIGTKIGSIFGAKFKSKAGMLGGLLLIGMGVFLFFTIKSRSLV